MKNINLIHSSETVARPATRAAARAVGARKGAPSMDTSRRPELGRWAIVDQTPTRANDAATSIAFVAEKRPVEARDIVKALRDAEMVPPLSWVLAGNPEKTLRAHVKRLNRARAAAVADPGTCIWFVVAHVAELHAKQMRSAGWINY